MSKTALKRTQDDLKSSGISIRKRALERLGVEPLSEEQVKEITGVEGAEGYKIYYHDLDGNRTDFYRIKFLYVNSGTIFDKKRVRYWQKPNSAPFLYFPKAFPWKKVTRGHGSVVITEGEKKAIACSEKIAATIGLGGVYSFKCKRLGKTMIDDFSLISWKDRVVQIIFDSDLATNPQVRQAQSELATNLTRLGAKVEIGILPSDGYEKIGLDDYLLTHDDLSEVDFTPFESCAALHDLNSELAYMVMANSYYHIASNALVTRSSILGVTHADRVVNVEQGGKLVPKNVAQMWMEWPMRRTHQGLQYAPGEPEVTDDNYYNLWKGYGILPEKGDISPFEALLSHTFQGDDDFKKWFIQWLAYPLQYPGTKLNQCVLLWSLEHGTGKSFIGYIMGDIYGSNFSVINQEQLQGAFNEWCINTQFVMGEEITGVEKRKDADRIKGMITRESVEVNKKHQPVYVTRDCVNYLFNSNHPDAFQLERYDRRFAIYQLKNGVAPKKIYNDLDKWRRKGGPAALFQHLLGVDLTGFNPKGAAPRSSDKDKMITLSMSDVDLFAEKLIKSPDSVLVMGDIKAERDLYTVTELMNFYKPQTGMTTETSLRRALARAGGVSTGVTRTKSGVHRLWAVRNMEQWSKAEHRDRSAHYDQNVLQFPDPTTPKKQKFV